VGGAKVLLAREEGPKGCTWIFVQGPGPEFLVTPLLIESVCLLSQDRFEEPVRPRS